MVEGTLEIKGRDGPLEVRGRDCAAKGRKGWTIGGERDEKRRERMDQWMGELGPRRGDLVGGDGPLDIAYVEFGCS